MNTWQRSQKLYRAKRKSRPGPGFASGEVLLHERNKKHFCDENPDGSILVYEGLVFRAYPTPKVTGLVSAGLAEEVPDRESAPDPNYIDDDLIGSIIDDNRIVDALQSGGLRTVAELVESYRAGDLETMKGIGPASREKIAWALSSHDLVRYEGDDF